MSFETEVAEMTPEDRRREIAALLARGVLRLRKRRIFDANSTSQEFSESAPNGLDVPRDTRLSVSTG